MKFAQELPFEPNKAFIFNESFRREAKPHRPYRSP